MALTWFSTKAVDELADSLIAELFQRFPSGSVDLSTKKAADRSLRTLERMYSSISAFALKRRPNLYQKARFGNRIKWALKDAGYPEPFIEIVTTEFVKQLTITARAK